MRLRLTLSWIWGGGVLRSEGKERSKGNEVKEGRKGRGKGWKNGMGNRKILPKHISGLLTQVLRPNATGHRHLHINYLTCSFHVTVTMFFFCFSCRIFAAVVCLCYHITWWIKMYIFRVCALLIFGLEMPWRAMRAIEHRKRTALYVNFLPV